MKRSHYFFIVALIATIAGGIFAGQQMSVKETIIFFPIDPAASYTEAATTITLKGRQENGGYTVDWRAGSVLDRKAYLRQDISLLFANGRLQKIFRKWKQGADKLVQETEVEGKDSAKFEAISFHYSELHEGEDKITSSQRMSGDWLYVIDSSFSPLYSFRVPNNKEDKEWKKIIDQNLKQQLRHSWSKAMKANSINEEKYEEIPLTDMVKFEGAALPGLNQRESAAVIGRLWEGIYKNYVLGIKKRDGTIIDPAGSTLPLVLLAKDRSELLVVFETSDGEPIILKQIVDRH
ncbi:hypothetical protein [Bacillus sp. T33-2]|uniref:hypothetical protein n=1 Tax=Bacillus sp. T33-2 TaxID=2054168 RepID=UPI000C7642EA|nr:hypothetical protein [Bacillus sp. T33-2]PLR89493.1 hypothetical protein CVD19_23735 [Bacillus sp. T33-2]